MKVLVLIVCVSISWGLVNGGVTYTDPAKECQANNATRLDEKTLDALDEGEIIDRPKVGAYLYCVFTKTGIQNQDGSINKNIVREKFSKQYADKPEELERVTNKCSEEGATAIETALKLADCVHEHAE